MIKLDMSEVLDFPELSHYMSVFEAALKKVLEGADPVIGQPLARLLTHSGKRLRPSLVMIIAAGQGRKIDHRVLAGCVAVELVHIGSLVHDDIIDNANTRWGIPTIHSVEGVATAILVGDYLFASACRLASTISAPAAQIVAQTIMTLCNGEAQELGTMFDTTRSKRALYSTIHAKTAALMATSCQLGGICSNLPQIKIDQLASYGESFGMSFQLVDDVLDLTSTEQLAGKPVDNDIKAGVYTLPIILALNGRRGNEVRQLLAKPNLSESKLTRLLIEDGSLQETIAEAKMYNAKAAKSWTQFMPDDNILGLAKLPATYMEWALTNMMAKQYKSRLGY